MFSYSDSLSFGEGRGEDYAFGINPPFYEVIGLI